MEDSWDTTFKVLALLLMSGAVIALAELILGFALILFRETIETYDWFRNEGEEDDGEEESSG